MSFRPYFTSFSAVKSGYFDLFMMLLYKLAWTNLTSEMLEVKFFLSFFFGKWITEKFTLVDFAWSKRNSLWSISHLNGWKWNFFSFFFLGNRSKWKFTSTDLASRSVKVKNFIIFSQAGRSESSLRPIWPPDWSKWKISSVSASRSKWKFTSTDLASRSVEVKNFIIFSQVKIHFDRSGLQIGRSEKFLSFLAKSVEVKIHFDRFGLQVSRSEFFLFFAKSVKVKFTSTDLASKSVEVNFFFIFCQIGRSEIHFDRFGLQIGRSEFFFIFCQIGGSEIHFYRFGLQIGRSEKIFLFPAKSVKLKFTSTDLASKSLEVKFFFWFFAKSVKVKFTSTDLAFKSVEVKFFLISNVRIII